MGNFDSFQRVPEKNFFYYASSGYNPDKTLYDLLLTEAYNKHGVSMQYYVITYDTSHDPLFGEDNNRRIERSFPVMVYYTLPTEDKMWTPAAMITIDNFHVYISKRHFAVASTLNTSAAQVFASYTPKVGDVMKAKYNEFYYEITHVAQEEEMFLETKHSWDVVLTQFKDESYTVSATGEVATDAISAVSNKLADIFNIADHIDTVKPEVLFNTTTPPEQAPNNPFGGW